jgi:aminopeptidase N
MRAFAVSAVVSALCATGFGQPTSFREHTGALAEREAKAFRTEMQRAAMPRDARAAETDVLHYALDIELQPGSTWLGGSNTMTVRSLTAGLTAFRFRLDDVFTITDVRVGGNVVAWQRLDPIWVEVTLDRPYAVEEVFALFVAYSGHPDSAGGLRFSNRNGHAEIFTQSEPWLAYTWWPAKDDLRDKTTADLWFTVPNTMKVASNGILRGVDDVGLGRVRYRWETEYPTADYLYCLGATNYDTFDSTWTYGGQTMPLNFFIFPEDNYPDYRAAWLACGQMLTVYSDLFGVYPFVNEKYGMLEWTGGGAMEHQTMTSMCCFWDSVIAHELSHQWWGDDVTCATWHDIWLNEGFATYCEALWYENQPGSPGESELHSYMSYSRPYDASGTIYVYFPMTPEQVFDGDLSYRKGAWVLHMLRHVVGDQAFYDVLAAYRALHTGGAATTQDFEDVAEAVTGRDLTWFFLEWIYNPGTPVYAYAWRPVVVDGQGYVELYIEQGDPCFTMPIDIMTSGAGGTHTHVVWNDAVAEHLLFPVESTAVTSLTFDPKPWILWYTLDHIDFVEGPPKIVTMNPAPGETLAANTVAAIEIVFHKDVLANGADFTLVGARHGPQSFTYADDLPRHAVVLTPTTPLLSDTYTLTVADTIIDVAASLALDGELVKPDGPNPLPSGDGLPGGAAVAHFALTKAGDVNCDGEVDLRDINPFVQCLSNFAAWQATYPGCPPQNADINGDGTYGQLSFGDINPFVALLGAGD